MAKDLERLNSHINDIIASIEILLEVDIIDPVYKNLLHEAVDVLYDIREEVRRLEDN